MKVCMSSRQIEYYLKKAHEIWFQFRDREAIPRFHEQFPKKTIILKHHVLKDDELDWEEIKQYQTLTEENFILCLDNIEEGFIAKDLDIPFYFDFFIESKYQLKSLKEMGVCYIMVGAPLFFDLESVATYDIPIRAIPNVAYRDGFPREDGVIGTWIRPENVMNYENYITTFEFEDCDINKEQALYRIYIEQKEWPGKLDMLISNLNHPAENRLIPDDKVLYRLRCGQRCLDSYKYSHCKLCYTLLDSADENFVKTIIDTKGGLEEIRKILESLPEDEKDEDFDIDDDWEDDWDEEEEDYDDEDEEDDI